MRLKIDIGDLRAKKPLKLLKTFPDLWCCLLVSRRSSRVSKTFRPFAGSWSWRYRKTTIFQLFRILFDEKHHWEFSGNWLKAMEVIAHFASANSTGKQECFDILANFSNRTSPNIPEFCKLVKHSEGLTSHWFHYYRQKSYEHGSDANEIQRLALKNANVFDSFGWKIFGSRYFWTFAQPRRTSFQKIGALQRKRFEM